MRIFPKSCGKISRQYEYIAYDKSLSHRSVIFSFLAKGQCEIENFLRAEDTVSTLEIAKILGASVQEEGGKIYITPPLQIVPKAQIRCNNSGTAMRLYSGLLASRLGGEYEFLGDESLSKRPMDRIAIPLKKFGAHIDHKYAPFILRGNKLQAVEYHSPVASAQVKGAFILASLFADEKSIFSEPELSRDHSERFLNFMGAEIERKGMELCIHPLHDLLNAYSFKIPNDPSSVVFFVIACLISQNLSVEFHNVLLNPTRIEAFEVLKAMGANLSYEIKSQILEPIGSVRVKSSSLKSIHVQKRISWLIDEIPALSIAFACAQGVSTVRGAKELKVKESNRIGAIVKNLNALGIEAFEFEDGFLVKGGEFRSGDVDSFGDHRIAMSFALAGIKTPIKLKQAHCVGISFPHFFKILNEYAEVEICK